MKELNEMNQQELREEIYQLIECGRNEEAEIASKLLSALETENFSWRFINPFDLPEER